MINLVKRRELTAEQKNYYISTLYICGLVKNTLLWTCNKYAKEIKDIEDTQIRIISKQRNLGSMLEKLEFQYVASFISGRIVCTGKIALKKDMFTTLRFNWKWP